MNKKFMQLGEPVGTATHRLRKMILFSLLQEVGRDRCFRCAGQIAAVEDLSVEHKHPWLDSEDPRRYFFDLGNIAFSHLTCNIGAARKPNQKYFTIEEQRQATRAQNAASMRRGYTAEKRREKYQRTGW